MKQKREEMEIDLKKLFMALVRRAWIIILVAILLATLGYSYAKYMIAPAYAANIKLFVNNTYGENSQGFSSSQMMAAQSLAYTYMVFLDSRDVLEAVRIESGLDYTVGQIRSMISASPVNETEVFQVTVSCAKSKDAAVIANAIAKVLPERIAYFLQVEGSSVVVVEHAVENRTPVGPNREKYATFGFLCGALITAILIIIANLLDTKIDSEEYLTQRYEAIPLLAVIPDADNLKNSGGYKGYYEAQKPRPAVKRNGGAK